MAEPQGYEDGHNIGARPYLERTGGTMTGPITFNVSGAAAPHILNTSGMGPTVLGKAASTSRSLGYQDVLFGNSVEVEGSAYFDGSIEVEGGLSADGDFLLRDSSHYIYARIINGLDDGLRIGIGEDDGRANRHLILTTYANRAKDHGHDALSDNPRWIIHSATDPTVDPTEYVESYHNQSHAVFFSGKGAILLNHVNAPDWGGGPGLSVAENFEVRDTTCLDNGEVQTLNNADIFLNPNGAGLVKFGTPAAITTETLSHYIPAKDAAGNAIKLAVVS